MFCHDFPIPRESRFQTYPVNNQLSRNLSKTKNNHVRFAVNSGKILSD